MEIELNTESYQGHIWHKKGDRSYWHREDGPARIYQDIEESWWYYDVEYNSPEDMPLNLFLAYIKWELKKNEN